MHSTCSNSMHDSRLICQWWWCSNAGNQASSCKMNEVITTNKKCGCKLEVKQSSVIYPRYRHGPVNSDEPRSGNHCQFVSCPRPGCGLWRVIHMYWFWFYTSRVSIFQITTAVRRTIYMSTISWQRALSWRPILPTISLATCPLWMSISFDPCDGWITCWTMEPLSKPIIKEAV